MLSALTERRGSAVLAYARAVAAPGHDVRAAADAFARFRLAVVDAEDPMHVHPERTLLSSVRAASAARAPLARRSALLGRRSSDRPCALIPELLAARAERTLTAADSVRLDRHLERCGACREAERRFQLGERAYREAPDTPVDQPVAREIMRALLAAIPAAPAAPTAPAAPEPEPELAVEPEPFVVVDPESEIHAAALTDDDGYEDGYEDEEDGPDQRTLVHGMAPLHVRQETYEFDALDLDELEAPRSTGPAEFPSFFAARTRPAQPAHPGLRFGAPAGVALLGLIVALVIAGVFASSDSSGATVSPAAAAVSTPLPAAPAKKPAPRRKARRTSTTTTPVATTSAAPSAAQAPAATTAQSAG